MSKYKNCNHCGIAIPLAEGREVYCSEECINKYHYKLNQNKMTNNRIEKALAEFEKKFTKKQDILNASPDNPIVYGIDPPVDKIVAFLKTTLEQFEKEIRGEVAEELQDKLPIEEVIELLNPTTNEKAD